MTKSLSSTPEGGGVIAILDAAYGSEAAAGACVLIGDISASEPVATRTVCLPEGAASYRPGAFYKRELPVLTALLSGLEMGLLAAVVDGYVHLDRDGKPGLGAHLAAALGGGVPVIGIAKSPFRGDDWSRSVCRGDSCRPLRVTAAGIDADEAARAVMAMHGPHRMPAMCRLADRLARETLRNATAAVPV